MMDINNKYDVKIAYLIHKFFERPETEGFYYRISYKGVYVTKFVKETYLKDFVTLYGMDILVEGAD